MAFLNNLWGYKLDNNWDFWIQRARGYRSTMRRKMRAVALDSQVPDRFRYVFAILDGKRFEICRPSGDQNQQAGAYNGYYGYHNAGFQGITAPDGILMHFSGPYPGSDSDLNFLADSHVLEHIQDALGDLGNQMDLLADKIYDIVANGLASLVSNPQDEEEVENNRTGSSVRIPVEWSFDKIVLHFPFFTSMLAMKINERSVADYLRVGGLLSNVHTTLYGSQCNSFFSNGDQHIILPPTLEEYMMV